MACQGCGDKAVLDFEFTMAFQPIVDLRADRVWGYEALVRGLNGEGAGEILKKVTPENRYRFDQECRVKAVELAAELFPDDGSRLSINFMPNAVYEPAACIRTTLIAAARTGFNPGRIMFEFTENEPFLDTEHVRKIVDEYRRQGFITAIDDFGAGFSGLNALARFTPDLLKIDMDLIRDIHLNKTKHAIVTGLEKMCRMLDVSLLAEGIETQEELTCLQDIGITLMQGYYFGRPQTGALPALQTSDLPNTKPLQAAVRSS
ncbi:EAL domain-containing protein [Roseibium sediminicola]|uniref:EAL domain-containing protein n=1 Tax=Roseibium sediminicola TaxID=2933272 RepID=A0ABT0H202_9HYPH|nr:EAL domain-containing protein [Roseibium sp. CAU 1639]MCK7615694.1 EAL domain-containing protein [Roseibium sp. CAU 1639]